MPNSLLAVKFFIPRPRPDLTVRLALLKRFEAGLQRPLTLISAPAGFGKTTLVSMWNEEQRERKESKGLLRVGWLSLDPADNDPLRFWLYFLTALQNSGSAQSVVGGGQSAETNPFHELIEGIQADSPPAIEVILDMLINELVQQPEAILLVLDDYHLIQAAQIHEQLTYLLDHQPAILHLAIITRVDPPLPLTRLRVRGQLSEFRSADLRFSKVETNQFLQSALGVEIASEDCLALEQSTEGWIAGLQMAALALQAPSVEIDREPKEFQAYAHNFIASFSGKHVYILDYLADEVFNRQPVEVRDFLLKTSVLEKMNVDLCDALIQAGAKNLNQPQGDSKAILDYIEKSNLFLIPLDQERRWFRYHHLFADLLRARLEETWPALRPVLLIRASEWFERAGSIEEAINYALDAGDWDRTAGLMERHIQSFLEMGQLSKIMEWVGKLPKAVATQRAGLIIQQAWVMGLAQRKDAFISLLNAAEQILARSTSIDAESDAENQRLRINLMILRGHQSVMEGNPQQALILLMEPLQSYPTGGLWEDCWMHWIRGFTHRMAGNLTAAIADFQQALNISKERLWVDMVCCTDLGMIYNLQGELHKAREIYLQGLALAKTHTAANHGYLIRLLGGFSEALLDLNELEEAVRISQMGLEMMKWWPSANARVRLFASLGRVRLAQGDLPAAKEMILLADDERQKWPLLPINDCLVDDALVRLWLSQKDLTTAKKWAGVFEEKVGPGLNEGTLQVDESMEMRLLALARVRLAEGERGNLSALEQGLHICATLEETTRKSGRIRSLIDLNLFLAVGLHLKTGGGGQRWDSTALSRMETALALGEVGGFLRVFLDGGPLVEGMIRALRSRGNPAQSTRFSQRYSDSILAAFPSGMGTALPTVAATPKLAVSLVEQLTERELEVLRLMASGLSNREMAMKLVLSEGTIKTHVHNLMGKLDAQSRTHALARAKEAGLL